MELQFPAIVLLSTRVLCWYFPVRIVERDGQHTGVVTNVFRNVAPSSPNKRRVFDNGSIPFIWKSRSSVSMNTTFFFALSPKTAAIIDSQIEIIFKNIQIQYFSS